MIFILCVLCAFSATFAFLFCDVLGNAKNAKETQRAQRVFLYFQISSFIILQRAIIYFKLVVLYQPQHFGSCE